MKEQNTSEVTSPSTTPKEKTVSFWDTNHLRQDEYAKLYKQLVPKEGEAETAHGELLRSISRLYYDYCNNGNMNAIETEEVECEDCGGYQTVECPCCHGNDNECDTCVGDGAIDCETCGGIGATEGPIVVTKYFREMLDYLIKHIGQDARDLEDFLMCSRMLHKDYKYDQKELDIYNVCVEKVLDYCKTHTNGKV